MNAQKTNFYKFKDKIGVVEILVNDKFSTIKNRLGEFTIEDKSLSQDNWQVLYMEQYFSADRSEKLCGTYDELENDTNNFNIVFFIFELVEGQILRTPFEKVIVKKLEKLPSEYEKMLEFEPFD